MDAALTKPIDETFTLQPILDSVVKSLVLNSEKVRIEETVQNKTAFYIIHVDSKEVGRVIGKEGSTAQAIRLLARNMGISRGYKVMVEIPLENPLKPLRKAQTKKV